MLLFAFDAPDVSCAAADTLSALPAQSWPCMRIRFHPSMQFFQAHWNSVEIWQALKAEKAPPAAIAEQTQQWLLWRNEERVTEFRALPAAEFDVLRSALAGNDFAVLCERLLDWHAPEDVSQIALELLQTWLSQGIIHRLVTD